jgi:hypothetical protein
MPTEVVGPDNQNEEGDVPSRVADPMIRQSDETRMAP